MIKLILVALLISFTVSGDQTCIELFDVKKFVKDDTLVVGYGMGYDAVVVVYGSRTGANKYDGWAILRQFQADSIVVICTLSVNVDSISIKGPTFNIFDLDSLLMQD